jgi:hypothetical protein
MNQQEKELFLTHALALGLAIVIINRGTGKDVESLENHLWAAARETLKDVTPEQRDEDFKNYKLQCEERGPTMFCLRVDTPTKEV